MPGDHLEARKGLRHACEAFTPPYKTVEDDIIGEAPFFSGCEWVIHVARGRAQPALPFNEQAQHDIGADRNNKMICV